MTEQEQADMGLAAALDSLQRSITERDRQLAKLGAAAPLRSKGRPVEDAGHLPLFVAANEPGLAL